MTISKVSKFLFLRRIIEDSSLPSADKFNTCHLLYSVVFVLCISSAACNSNYIQPTKRASVTAVYEPTDEGITKLFNDIQKHIANKNVSEASEMVKSLIPAQKSDVEFILNMDRAGSSHVVNCVLNSQKFYSDIKDVTAIFRTKPERTQVNVHSATTEEIAKNEAGSTVYNEFPAGIIPLASAGVLKPKITFYEIEKVEPGKNMGLKWHLFAHTPGGWKMFGPIWRAFMKDEKIRIRYCGG